MGHGSEFSMSLNAKGAFETTEHSVNSLLRWFFSFCIRISCVGSLILQSLALFKALKVIFFAFREEIKSGSKLAIQCVTRQIKSTFTWIMDSFSYKLRLRLFHSRCELNLFHIKTICYWLAKHGCTIIIE